MYICTISYVTERMPTKIERSLHYRDFVVPKKFPKLVVELRRALFGFTVTQWNLTVYVNG
ncbi:hypothetical protein EMIHUDRAFT_195349 [Emiliania huxleyi CCMP1516]|uniref:Uncharacterized protein n=2 Tax=Emiliania huxleyi TaxID=2903 RepID=A0A0D3JHC9_EMIH1|nr:hypothetical protein EMIHUDRAFT_195349 [Emiliania huxleyi CCMP1516]EOD22914.1 hypothetical protein EMIHUDRAFT_195349 [Emiliania huxleyi CCMP1516]|eukprot:XP_005775343.1 hypothetical protein EMIHUDRAFT_195349 [Emiliania huxleyi CCMP1516]